MKSIVASLLLNFCLAFSVVPDRGRVRCKCRPSPPGGVTECQSGQTAVCGANNGTCKGSCISVSAQLQPLQYTAELFSKVFNATVTVAALETDKKAWRKNTENVLKSNRTGQDVKIELNGKTFVGSFGLSELAKKNLLTVYSMLGGKNVHIRAPRIRIGLP
ncbi:MAG: hypothetical protein H7Z16_05610 [Pyrinomonadaceae bacterium]|nr:hypothetical protein [Pyrinomonadaceae bacterium]